MYSLCEDRNHGLLVEDQLKYISFSAYMFGLGEEISLDTGNNECAVVILSGKCDIESDKGSWEEIGERMNVFDGLPPYVLFLPHNSEYKVRALTELHFAVALTPSNEDIQPYLVRPAEIQKSERGSGGRLRFVSKLNIEKVKTKLVLFEVFSPEGNWSSYPPHKHDEENPPKENLLEEFYYYQFKPQNGFALHWNSNDDLTLDAARSVRNGDLMPVPEGYHTVVTAPGYDCYYLNAMAGPTTNWNFTVHPQHAHLQDY